MIAITRLHRWAQRQVADVTLKPEQRNFMFFTAFKWWFKRRMRKKVEAFAQQQFVNLTNATGWIHVGPVSIMLRQAHLTVGWSLVLETVLTNEEEADLGLDQVVLQIVEDVARDNHYSRVATKCPMIPHAVLKQAGFRWEYETAVWWKDILDR
jgi:hypothetical protein